MDAAAPGKVIAIVNFKESDVKVTLIVIYYDFFDVDTPYSDFQ